MESLPDWRVVEGIRRNTPPQPTTRPLSIERCAEGFSIGHHGHPTPSADTHLTGIYLNTPCGNGAWWGKICATLTHSKPSALHLKPYQTNATQSAAKASANVMPKGRNMTNTPTPEKDPKTGRFLAGNSGNGGRRKGARAKLGEQFCQDVLAEWEAHGAVALSDMREKNPGDFVKVVASMLPKEATLNINDHSEMTDDELAERVRNLAAQLAPFLGDGTGDTNEGTGRAAVSEKSPRVH